VRVLRIRQHQRPFLPASRHAQGERDECERMLDSHVDSITRGADDPDLVSIGAAGTFQRDARTRECARPADAAAFDGDSGARGP
jgi:hypothetical protein